ncbi:TRAP transporter substrate-binding protein [Methylibium sp.]|uniref:TRAP transporter substrate-binding protein n=1 Tax=Methylibium sp. TaxID=2067992 RepID=UPI001849F53F|nr:TRAP transporter substrate-binding protein [Methylibium sp.]MBA3588820.1 TRAP transporter substrate-binding protein [Methylibium sp.]
MAGETTRLTRRRALGAGAAALASAGALTTGPARAQGVTRMKIQTAVPTSSIYFDLMKRFGERCDKMSNGRLKMEMLPDGAVVNAFEMLDAVDKGVVDGGYSWAHYWSGKNSAAGLFSNPAAGGGTGMDQLSHVAWLMQGGGNALYKRFYADVLKVNVEPFMLQPMGPDPLGWFKAPISSLEDMRKLKYRAPPGLVGEIFKEMGINAVAMPGGEIVPAAQRGVIDAAEWIGPADDVALGFHTVFKHYYLQGLHQSTDVGEVLINKTVWNKLPADLKAVVEASAMATMMETYSYNVHRNAQALQRLKTEFKVTVHDTPKDIFPAFIKATNLVYDREAGKNPFFKEVLDSQRAFAKIVVPYWNKINGLYFNLGMESPNAT